MRPDTSRWRAQSSYDFIDRAPVDHLAWECLRRNHDYQKVYDEAERQGDLNRPLHVRQGIAGGCDFAAAPHLSARDQTVFWSENADTAVLRLVTGIPPPAGSVVTLRTFLSGEMRLAPGELHLLLRDIGAGAHLIVDAWLHPDAPLAVCIPLDRDGLDRLAALDRLLRHLNGYKVPPDQRITAQQRRRLKAMLQAVDGQQHHAGQREIAEVIFGAPRVADEHWPTSPLRDAVRDLLQDGAAMIAGGYRKLLRFRRRP